MIYEKETVLVFVLMYLSKSAEVLPEFNDADGVGLISVFCRIRVD